MLEATSASRRWSPQEACVASRRMRSMVASGPKELRGNTTAEKSDCLAEISD